MKIFLRFLLTLLSFTLFCGCATTGDLQRVQGRLGSKLGDHDSEIAALNEQAKANRKALEEVRAKQADLGADLTAIREQIQQIRGAVEELRKETADIRGRVVEAKEWKEKIDQASFKVNFIENFLGIGKKDERAPANAEKHQKNHVKNGVKAKSDKESLYAAAYDLYKEGKYEKARGEFQNFLKAYPQTEYSGNAQFWIGECYYFEKSYEKAILEYEKVIKNYPEGNKVPQALLKQGLSFLELDDKASARLILQNVIKDYPNTSQARVARSKLLEIK
ncbi:MAG: tol-pal system protein YbgF [Pseudomonadota bacterium]|nr:tol-pal system protein YbgF [Pseudomonadota bacterium]